MEEMNGAEILVKSLEDLGVKQIFGTPERQYFRYSMPLRKVTSK
jgi:thiamine pyrophosphate-dependent acetolactate synthase large subunit-like protein